MYWTLELATYLTDAPWPANKDELIDYCIRTGAPLEVIENLQEIEEEEEETMNQFSKYGQTIPLKMTIFGMKMNISSKNFHKVSFEAFFLFKFDHIIISK